MVNRTVPAILAALLLAGGLRADIIPQGMKPVANTVVVDYGPLAPSLFAWYEVKSGDTFSALAEEHLGDAARWPEIAAANPGLDPRKVVAGKHILIPPRTPIVDAAGAVVAKGWHAFFWNGFGSAPVERLGDEDTCSQGYHMMVIALVRDDVLDSFLAATTATDERRDSPGRIFRAKPAPAWSAQGLRFARIANRRVVRDTSDAVRRTTRCTLAAITDDGLVVEETITDFAADGRELSAVGAPRRVQVAQLGLAALALALALGIGLHRRRSA